MYYTLTLGSKGPNGDALYLTDPGDNYVYAQTGLNNDGSPSQEQCWTPIFWPSPAGTNANNLGSALFQNVQSGNLVQAVKQSQPAEMAPSNFTNSTNGDLATGPVCIFSLTQTADAIPSGTLSVLDSASSVGLALGINSNVAQSKNQLYLLDLDAQALGQTWLINLVQND